MLAEFIHVPKEGETLGPYLLKELLSTSIFGSFFTALHRDRMEPCLIHILPEALLKVDKKFPERLKATLDAQKRLNDGPILKSRGQARIQGNLVIEYPSGEFRSLSKLILSGRKPLPVEDVRDYLRDIAEAFADAAKIDQGHFFLTPDFLFLDTDGQIRVAGLGLFQSIPYGSFERYVSGVLVPVAVDTSRSFSALEILSPEIRNRKARDPRSDFYCLGMCAYFMLTGMKPERRWAVPSKARKGLSEGWDLLVSACLESNPSDRFPHYRAFLNDLKTVEELPDKPRREGGRLLRRLDLIPLPKALERRLGLRALFFLRLILLGVAGLLAVRTAVMLQEIIITDVEISEPREFPEPEVVGDIKRADFQLRVEARGAQVVVDGPMRGRFFVPQGSLLLKMRPGAYRVEVAAPFKRKEVFEMTIVRGSFIERDIQLVDDFVPLAIRTLSESLLFIRTEKGDWQYLSEASADGPLELDRRILRGTYDLLALKENHYPALAKGVSLESDTGLIDLQPMPFPAQLVVSSDPAGAFLTVNDEAIGLTPQTIETLPTGVPLVVKVDKAAYRTLTREIELTPGSTLQLDLGPLELRRGLLDLNVEWEGPAPPNPETLQLFADDKLLLIPESGEIEIVEGSFSIRVQHPDFFPGIVDVTIADAEVTEVTVELKPLPMQLIPRLGKSVPTRYFIGNEPVVPDEAGRLILPANESIELTAFIRDHMTVKQPFMGRANQQIDWEIPMVPLPGPVEGEEWALPYSKLVFAWLGEGEFVMGSPVRENRRVPNEGNRTRIVFNYPYWISQTEVTQETFQNLMGRNPSSFKGPEKPVEMVSWETATAFCKKLTEVEASAGRLPQGYVYRLPTEMEWERAARAGSETPFWYGEQTDPSRGNFQGRYSPDVTTGRSADDRYGTLPVGSFPANPYGLFDVHGNVAEWMLDLFWDRHPGGRIEARANLDRGRGRTVRGGSWKDSADRVRSAAREAVSERSTRNSIGFRVVLGPEF
jgi:formylglycine-generating enzyme required for sulfatase activity